MLVFDSVPGSYCNIYASRFSLVSAEFGPTKAIPDKKVSANVPDFDGRLLGRMKRF